MVSNLYEKHNYLNKDIEYLISREIIEYDIKSAGFNLIKHYKLLDDSKISHLESLSKKQRQITIGLYQKNNKKFAEELNSKFVEARKTFFTANDLIDDDVLSIKKDAIITLRRCYNTEFDNIQFDEKNIYTSYFYMNKFEFYLGDTKLDVKGISDDKLLLHQDYMIDFLQKILKMLEVSSTKQTIVNLKEFAYYYKNKLLHHGYYRELNRDSLYRLNNHFNSEYIGTEDFTSIEDIDISYNYMKYVVPLINILI